MKCKKKWYSLITISILATPHYGAIIAREIYYYVVHYRRRLLSNLSELKNLEKWIKKYRSVIPHLLVRGKSRNENKECLNVVYGDSSLSLATVKTSSVFDEPRAGGSKSPTMEENMTKSTISYLRLLYYSWDIRHPKRQRG